jgi:hypothetical protein
MVPLDSDTVWGNATDWISGLEVYSGHLEGDWCIPPCHHLDLDRIGCNLQRHNDSHARILEGEHRRDNRHSACPDQCMYLMR